MSRAANCSRPFERISFADQALQAFGTRGASCFSGTLNKQMPDNACVQSKFDGLWYQCDNGSWVDRFTDPEPCNGVHPLGADRIRPSPPACARRSPA